jgi:hypothetical protein
MFIMATAANVRHLMYRSPTAIADPGSAGSITIDKDGGVCHVTTLTSEARTLVAPTKSGIHGRVVLDVDGGDLTLTVNPASGTCYGYNAANATSIVFGDAGDFVDFVSIKIGTEYVWRILGQEGTNATMTGGGTVTSQTITTLASTTATLSKLLGAITSVNAAGSVAANAGVLTTNMINIVGAADNTKCVILPVAVAGQVVIVKSTVASKTLPVFPQVNSYINGTQNTAATLDSVAAGASAIFVASDSTNWYTISGDLA